LEHQRRLRYAANSAAPAINNTSEHGSDTETTEDEFVTGAPASAGSKMNVPSAPMVKLVPSGITFAG
jgi:hypothetical protein